MIYKLSDICTIKYGKDHKKLSDGNIPVYGSGGVMRYVDKYLYNKKSVMIPRKGTLGNLFFSDMPFWTVDTLFYTEIDENLIVPEYLYYYLKTINLVELNVGTAVPSLTTAVLNDIEMDIPSIQVQNQIVQILDILDKKIKTNEKINDNLLQQALAIFNNYSQTATIEVPFTQKIQILGGGTPKTSESSYWNGKIQFFTPKDIGLPYTLFTEKTITENGLKHCNSRLYEKNTVFVTARGTVGKVGLAGQPMAMNQSCYALIGNDTHQILVYHYTLQTIERLKHKASGAVFDAITTKDFESETIKQLSLDAEKQFITLAEPLYQEILSNCIENTRLMSLRDSLLPKLMNGEIDVSNIQL